MKTSALACLFFLLCAQPADAQYKTAVPGYHFEFPRDHLSHSDFQTEWWYYTGNLTSADGHRFGFELTFFRQAINPQEKSNPHGTFTTSISPISPSAISMAPISTTPNAPTEQAPASPESISPNNASGMAIGKSPGRARTCSSARSTSNSPCS